MISLSSYNSLTVNNDGNRDPDSFQENFSYLPKKNEVNLRIKALRKQVGLKQGEFAKQIGISQSSLSEIENERSGASISAIIGISKNIPYANMNWLLTGEGGMYKSQSESSASIAENVPQLSERDSELLETFHALSDEKQAYALGLVKMVKDVESLTKDKQLKGE